jgi:hypothetical protein
MTIYNNDFIFLKNIKSLSIYGGNIDGSGLKYLSNIEVISIYENPIVDEYFNDLFEFNNIRQINIYRCRTVTNRKKEELRKFFGNKINTDISLF